MSALLHSEATITSRSFGDECIKLSLKVSVSYVFPPPALIPHVVQVSSGTYHRSIQTSYSSSTTLDGGSLASHSPQHVARHSITVFSQKGSCKRCFSRLGAPGLPLLHLTLWLLRDMCCIDKGSLPQSVRL